MAYITKNELHELDEWQAEVRNAYGECLIDGDKVTYLAEPSEDLTEAERRQSLEGLLDHIADIMDDQEDQLEQE
jgi:hypothetical protein